MSDSWKQRLADLMPPDLAREIDVFEQQIQLRRDGKLDEKIFAETRLRRGAYGQRYDNGQRHDGLAEQELTFPSDGLTKGPETVWDAPGMMRIKIPFGGLTPNQLDLLAEVADEYSDAILHVTTRQDFQLHYIHIDDTPDLMRRLASVGITTREACGNSVRNVTCCPIAGVCREETFDVTPYSKAIAYFLLGHPDCQDFGRKFKVAFSGCAGNGCGLTTLHDLGYIARVKEVDGKKVRGFETYVGGGLGAVPHQAKLLYEFMPVEEMMPVALSICRVFARLGEKANRNRARVKFLVAKLGIEEFKRLVEEERKILPEDEAWHSWLSDVEKYSETAVKDGAPLNGVEKPEGFESWASTNVYQQRQAGYATVTIALPLGDMSTHQARVLADITRKFSGENLRTSVEQNMLLRWVSEADLVELYKELDAVGLSEAGAGTIVDITTCPGTDTCKLGIASSRGLAAELRTRLAAKNATLDDAVKNLHIKISGCFNSCGQHHVADLGFYGNSRNVGGYTVPHFQVVLGGKWEDNGGSYGLAIGAVPSKRIPDTVELITDWYVAERVGTESFQDFIKRVGKKTARAKLEPMMAVPSHDVDTSFYVDWSDAREFTIGDMGVGECAGEIVSQIEFDLSNAEREVFEAQLALDDDNVEQADQRAFNAMLIAARGLVKKQWQDVPEESAVVVSEFRTRFYDTELFFDKFAKGKFAQYLFARHEEDGDAGRRMDMDVARTLIEEAQLFIEAAHACDARMTALPGI